MNTSLMEANTISFYQIMHKAAYGSFEDRSRSDLLRVVMIRLPNEKQAEKAKNKPSLLHKMLLKMFSMNDSAEEKCRSLQDDYGIRVNADMEKEMNQMCNLSQIVKEEGIKQGRTEGIKQGRTEGRQQGRTEGYEKGLLLLMRRDNREEEFLEAINDSVRKNELLEEYGFLD